MREELIKVRIVKIADVLRYMKKGCESFVTRQRYVGSVNWATFKWTICVSECDYAYRCYIVTYVEKLGVDIEVRYGRRVADIGDLRDYADEVIEKV